MPSSPSQISSIKSMLAETWALIERSSLIFRHQCACGRREFFFDPPRHDDPPRRRRYTCPSCETVNEFDLPDTVGTTVQGG